MEWPLGYRWTYGPWEEMQREQSREMLDNLLLALLLVFAVMAGSTRSICMCHAALVATPIDSPSRQKKVNGSKSAFR